MIDFSAYILSTKELTRGSGMYVYATTLEEDYEMPNGSFGPFDVLSYNCLYIKNGLHEELISRYD